MKTKSLQNSLLLLALLAGNAAQAKVVLPSVFSDNMVLQQKTDAAIWGKTTPGKTVSISTTWSKKSYTAKAGFSGAWKINVATPVYGGPYTINISDGDITQLKNVLIGEVWVCSGQSNMEMPLAGWGKIKDYQQEIAAANYPDIRLLQAEHIASNLPLTDAKLNNGGGWQTCSPASVAEFSAVAYSFAREVYKKKGIPIGLIHTSWGGTVAEAWTSKNTLKDMPDFAEGINRIEAANEGKSGLNYQQRMEAWKKLVLEKDAGYHQDIPVWAANSFDASSWKKMALPAYWSEAELPAFDGSVWFRKEVKIPASWAGKDLKINLGTIDDNEQTFFNGSKIGETEGHVTPRLYTIPANKVKTGLNVITVRVFDSGGDGGIYGNKNVLSLTSSTGERISLDGEWQYKAGLNLKDIVPVPVADDGPNRPTVLFNAMINPYLQYAIRGAIWYQGESNEKRAHQYRELFPALIKDWRKQWNRGDFPFYFVQLANYKKTDEQPVASDWAEIRDAQLHALALPHTGMAVTIDVGERDDVHPKNKQEVGRRLALIALAQTYGEKSAYSGPLYTEQSIRGNEVTLKFKFTEGGLTAKGDVLKGFAVAGEDQKFHWATARIKGSEVIVSSPEVKNPVAVRYAWANNPVCNLYNGADLPASPFRTDNWQDSTYGNK